MFKSVGIFILAGFAEIGGGYLIWQWLKEDKSWLLGLLEGIVLCLYGVIATFQTFSSFGKVYAAYGGIFIILSILWGWVVDKRAPDVQDWIGALFCIIGVTCMLWTKSN